MMEDDEREEDVVAENTAWHLDKKVPIGIIAALLVQTMVLVYFGTTWKVDVESRLGILEKSDERQAPQETRIVIMEQQLTYIRESLRRIEDALIAAQNGNGKGDLPR